MKLATQAFALCLVLVLVLVLVAGVGCGAPASAPRAPAPRAAASIATTPPAVAPAPAPYGTPAQLAAWVDAYVAGFGGEWGEAAKPNGYLIVAKDGVPVVERAYGKTVPERGAAPGPDTGFRIGSVTKQFTAVAILQLVERKRLVITDGVRKLLPELPASFEPITIHNLLTHTSGISNYTDDESLRPRIEHIERARVLTSIAAKPPAFAPGAEFAYSNSNYFLLGMIVEKVSGATYEEYLQKYVFGPAGMKHSTSIDRANAPDYAIGLTVDASDHVLPIPPDTFDNDASLPFSAGAIRSTAHDLVLWDRALGSGKLLGTEAERVRSTPLKDDYACGVTETVREGHHVEAHSGGISGFSSHFARVPDLGIVVAFLGNSDSFEAGSIARPVLKMALTGRGIPPEKERPIGVADANVLSSIAGAYVLSPASRVDAEKKLPKPILESVLGLTARVEDGRIVLKPSGQPPFLIFPAKDAQGASLFFTKTAHIEVSLTQDRTGKVTGARLTQSGISLDYVRR